MDGILMIAGFGLAAWLIKSWNLQPMAMVLSVCVLGMIAYMVLKEVICYTLTSVREILAILLSPPALVFMIVIGAVVLGFRFLKSRGGFRSS